MTTNSVIQIPGKSSLPLLEDCLQNSEMQALAAALQSWITGKLIQQADPGSAVNFTAGIKGLASITPFQHLIQPLIQSVWIYNPIKGQPG